VIGGVVFGLVHGFQGPANIVHVGGGLYVFRGNQINAPRKSLLALKFPGDLTRAGSQPSTAKP